MRSPIVACVVLVFGACLTFAQYSSPQLHNGTTFVAFVDHSIRASHAKPGDPVALRVAQAFLLNGEVVPKGAKIKGHVVVARRVDKKAKLGSLLSVVADTISWKKRSVRISGWIVGFGSIKFSTPDSRQSAAMGLSRKMMEKMRATADRTNPKYNMPIVPEVFTTFETDAGNTTYDSARFVRDLKLLRRPEKSIGTMLVHDDGDIYLPRDLLVLLEEIDTGNSASDQEPQSGS